MSLLKLMSPRRYLDPSYLVRIAGNIYGGVFREDPKYAFRHASMAQPPAGVGYIWQLYAMAGWTSIHRLRNLEQPTLILAGSDDPLVPAINAHLMAKLIPNSTVKVLPCGHLFLMTKPQLAVEAIEAFMKDN